LGSFDFDLHSVACTTELKRRFSPGDTTWQIEQGSILDKEYLQQLGQFDIVYSWGVLHHTGDMWGAIRNAASLVQPGGTLAIGIYNFKSGRRGTRTWQKLKRWYCAAPWLEKVIWEYTYVSWNLLYLLLVGRNPVKIIREHKIKRGMSWFRDVTDWLGGYPYEAATPGEILEFVHSQFGYVLIKQNINCDLGVSEFVFRSLRR
jgi:SAM-dependent methyltransferase